MLYMILFLFGMGLGISVNGLCNDEEKNETKWLVASVVCFVGFAVCFSGAVAIMP